MKNSVLLFLSTTLFTLNALADKPNWVESPDEAGYRYAIVGSAMPQAMGKAAQVKQAQLSARQAFSANQTVYIQSIQKSHESEDAVEFQSASQLTTHAFQGFSHLQQVDEWQDPQSGELFLLYAIE